MIESFSIIINLSNNESYCDNTKEIFKSLTYEKDSFNKIFSIQLLAPGPAKEGK